MSFSEQSFSQCEDCGRSIERTNKKHCRTCGKKICSECNYAHFGYCKSCRNKFEERPVEEKYQIMKMFLDGLKSGPIFLMVLGAMLGIASIVLAFIFLFSGRNRVLIYIAAGEFPPGSMGPKAEAALEFLAANPGGRVIIGHVEEQAERLLDGLSGTTIVAG